MVGLETLLQSAQDADGVLHVRGGDHDGLEAALQRLVLLHVQAMLGQGGRADAVQLAARQHGLEHVARVAGPLGLAGADDGVDLVDEEDDPPLAGLDLLEHGLQAFLEVAAVFRAGHQRRQVQGEDGAVLQPLGHVAAHDALGEPLHDGRLAHARLADEHGVVLRLAREDADDVADLGVAADHGVKLPPARHLHQIRAVFLQRLVAVLRVVARDALVAAHLLQCRQERLLREPQVAQDLHPPGHLQQHMLDREILVAHPLGPVERRHQDLLQALGDVDLVRLHRAGHARQPVQRLGHPRPRHLRRDAALLQQAPREPLLLRQKGPQHMLRLHRLLLPADALLLRHRQRLAQTFGHLIHVHNEILLAEPPRPDTSHCNAHAKRPATPAIPAPPPNRATFICHHRAKRPCHPRRLLHCREDPAEKP